MSGERKTVEVSPGVELEIAVFSSDENDKYTADYPKLTSIYTKQSSVGRRHVISEWFDETVEVFRILGQACKSDIRPNAGVFQGMRAQTGFGFTMIRPDYLVPAAQGRTFDVAASAAITADAWFGLYHNGAIGAAYGAAPLYLRKELGIGWVGMHELKHDPIADEMQIELNGKPLPVWNMLLQMGRAKKPRTVAAFVGCLTGIQSAPPTRDLKVFRFPSVEYLKPAIQYRSQFKANATGVVGVQGDGCLCPLGIAFVTSEFLRRTAPTAPTTVAP